MSACIPKADMCSATEYVRFVPKADITYLTRPTSQRIISSPPGRSGKSFDFVFGQLRGDQPHAAIDVIATLARRIELKLLNEIFVRVALRAQAPRSAPPAPAR